MMLSTKDCRLDCIPGVALEELGEAGVGETRLWHADQEGQTHIFCVGPTQTLVIGPVGPLTHSKRVCRKKLRDLIPKDNNRRL